MEVIQNLIKQYGQGSCLAAVVFSLLFWIAVIARYISGRERRSTLTKVFDVILMFIYIGLFVSYILAGLSLGDMFLGSKALGLFLGLVIFWVMFEAVAYAKKKRVNYF